MSHICGVMLNGESNVEANMRQIHLAIYKCGDCNIMFETICVLHDHMQSHVAGGSYHYNHVYLTAFPKYGSECTSSQTDLDDFNSSLSPTSGSQRKLGDNNMGESSSHLFSRFSSYQDFINEDIDCVNEHDVVRNEGQKNVNQDCSESKNEDAETGFKISKRGEGRMTNVEKNSINNTEALTREATLNTEDVDESMLDKQSSSDDSDVETVDPNYEPPVKRNLRKERTRPVRAVCRKSKIRKTTTCKEKSEHSSSKNQSKTTTCKEKSEHSSSKNQSKTCHVCEKLLKSPAALKRHMKIVHSEERVERTLAAFKCDFCKVCLNSRKDLQKHIKEEHREHDKKISCPYCEKELLSSASKSKHIDTEHPEIASVLKRFHVSKDSNLHQACEVCGKLFTTAAGLALHMSSIHLKKKFKCDICNVELSQKFTLKAHKIEKHHIDMRGFDCNICKKTFAYKFRLKAHIEQVHTSSEDINSKYICETCGYFAKSKAGLRYHLKKHDEQRKQYQCEICTYKTYYKCSLTEHTASHEGNRRFVCDACGDKFLTGKQLKVHMRRHTGEMPYQCEICSKRFRTDIAYARHKDIHLNRMRFKCEYCDKQFVQKTNCLAHMRQHTGEKPFKCDWCGHSFTHNVSRKNHMNKCILKPGE